MRRPATFASHVHMIGSHMIVHVIVRVIVRGWSRAARRLANALQCADILETEVDDALRHRFSLHWPC